MTNLEDPDFNTKNILANMIQEETTQRPSQLESRDFSIDDLFNLREDAIDIAPRTDIHIQKDFRKQFGNINISAKGDPCKQIKQSLKPHQKMIANYYSKYHSSRGILLYHGTGTGKTLTSIAMAYSIKNDIDNIIVLLPASLKANFAKNLVFFNNILASKEKSPLDPDMFSYVTVNANIRELPNLSNRSLVIIDECQIFVSRVVNASPSSTAIFKQLCDNTCRIIQLSHYATRIYVKDMYLKKLVNRGFMKSSLEMVN